MANTDKSDNSKGRDVKICSAYTVLPNSALVLLEIEGCAGLDRLYLQGEDWLIEGKVCALNSSHGVSGANALCSFSPLPSITTRARLIVNYANGDVVIEPILAFAPADRSLINQILEVFTPDLDQIGRSFALIGTVIQETWQTIVSGSLVIEEMVFGEPPARVPRFSVIIPLYGRLDLLQFQLALFEGVEFAELIYVLDQPERRNEVLSTLPELVDAFGLSLRLVIPSQSLGFGKASNIGLERAVGEFICFLNSDVIPISSNWLDVMAASLDASEDIGVVGARLLFPDGSIQHDGMTMTANSEYGGWFFPCHPGKGLRPFSQEGSLVYVDGVTGACMLMRRMTALEHGGFDLAYLIGDFEDADLCLRLRVNGLRAAVDRRVTLYHLERQSQGGAPKWRENLTLLNAMTFNTRFGNVAGTMS